jgi:ferredoxin
LPASKADIPLDFGTLEGEGCFIGSAAWVVLSDKDDMKAVALNLLRFFEDESCGQCTPCRVGTEKAVMLMNEPRWDEDLLTELTRVMTDLHRFCGLGQAAMNPGQDGGEAFPRRSDERRESMSEPIRFSLDGTEVEAQPGETIWQVAQRHGIEIPHLCWLPKPGYRADGNCRACMVEIEGRAGARCLVHPAAHAGDEGARRERAGQGVAATGVRIADRRSAGTDGGARSGIAAVAMGQCARHRCQPVPAAAGRRRPTAAIRRWRCSSTPASTAICASALAARCRSTT